MKRYADEEIVKLLREAETTEEPVTAFCRRTGISEQTFYRWRAKYGGMDVSEARRLKILEAENQKLKRMLAEAMLTNEGLKELLAKKW